MKTSKNIRGLNKPAQGTGINSCTASGQISSTNQSSNAHSKNLQARSSGNSQRLGEPNAGHRTAVPGHRVRQQSNGNGIASNQQSDIGLKRQNSYLKGQSEKKRIIINDKPQSMKNVLERPSLLDKKKNSFMQSNQSPGHQQEQATGSSHVVDQGGNQNKNYLLLQSYNEKGHDDDNNQLRTVYMSKSGNSQNGVKRRRDGDNRVVGNLSIQGNGTSAPPGLPPQSSNNSKGGPFIQNLNLQNQAAVVNISRQRPKSSVPNSKSADQNAHMLNQMRLMNRQVVNQKSDAKNIRDRANVSNQQYANAPLSNSSQDRNKIQNQNLAHPSGQNMVHLSAPQSASLREHNSNLTSSQGIAYNGSSASGARKNKPVIVVNYQNQPNQQYLVNKQMQIQQQSQGQSMQSTQEQLANGGHSHYDNSQPGSQTQQNQFQATQAFFQKRNRSRGAVSGTQINGNQAQPQQYEQQPQGGFLVTLQPPTGQRTASVNMLGASPQSALHPGGIQTTQKIKPSKPFIIQQSNDGSSQTVEYINSQKALINEFSQSDQLTEPKIIQQSNLINQIQNYNSGNNKKMILEQSQTMNGGPPPQMGDSLRIPRQYQQLQCNSQMNARYQNVMNSKESNLTTQLTDHPLDNLRTQSFDKRNNLQYQITATTASASGNQILNNSDMKNKENLTQKVDSRKMDSHQLIPQGEEGTSTKSFNEYSSRIGKQLNSLMGDQNSVDQMSQSSGPIQYNKPNTAKNMSHHAAQPNQNLHSLTNLKTTNELQNDIRQDKHLNNMTHSLKQQSTKHRDIQQIQQQNLEMHLLPSTNKYYKRTYRHFFKRRMNQMDRPIIIVNFQGVIGDFFKDQGLSSKQDHIMSKQYAQSIRDQVQGLPMGLAEQNTQSNLWINKGANDGKAKPEENNNCKMKQPNKQGEIWEDYKQIYLDFSLNNDQVIRDRVLFVNSIDRDFDSRKEDGQFDPCGYFMIDTRSKPAVPLVQGLPLSYETKEKEIDLSDKGGFLFNKNAQKETQTKEMPVTVLIPNPRSMYSQQISFLSIAKTLMTLCFFGQKKAKMQISNLDDINSHLNSITLLKEFDVKVQRDQCLLQYNPVRQFMTNQYGSTYNTQVDHESQNSASKQLQNQTQQNISRGNIERQGSSRSFDPQNMARPRSSNSLGRILNNKNSQPQNHYVIQQDQYGGPADQSTLEESQMETMVIPLTDQFFQNISWAASFDFVDNAEIDRQILGLYPVRSNLVWRYFLSLLKQRSNIKQYRQKRVAELKKLIEKLDYQQTDEGKQKRQQQIQEIYDKLKQVQAQTNGNPLTNMMARNFKVFIKIYAEVKRKSRRELENVTEALLMDQKMAELEKQNLENRIFVLGAVKPGEFFNTHPRVYEKVQIQFNHNDAKYNLNNHNNYQISSGVTSNKSMAAVNHQVTNSQTYNLMYVANKRNQALYSSISSNENTTNNNNEFSQRSQVDNSNSLKPPIKSNKVQQVQSQPPNQGPNQTVYGKKKGSSNGVISVAASGTGNFSTNGSSVYNKKKIKGHGPNLVVTEGSTTRRSNQSTDHQEGKFKILT